MLIAIPAWNGLDRIRHHQIDFPLFWQDGRHVWESGRIDPAGRLEWYLPPVPLAFAALGALPYDEVPSEELTWSRTVRRQPAGLLWWAVNVALTVWIVRTIGRRLAAAPSGDWPVHQFLPVLLLCPALYQAFRYNQLSVSALALLLAGYLAMERRRDSLAGALLGLAALYKLLPALFVVMLVAKRRWRALIAWGVTIVAVDAGAALGVGGPGQIVQLHRRWLRNVRAAGHVAILYGDDGTLRSASNFALPAVIARVDGGRSEFARNVLVGGATLALVGLGLGAYLRTIVRGTRRSDERSARIEFALTCVIMLWAASLQRGYHLLLLYPAVAIVLAERRRFVLAGGKDSFLAIVTLVWLLAAYVSPLANLDDRGAHLAAEALLFAGLMVAHARIGVGSGGAAAATTSSHGAPYGTRRALP